MMKAIKVNLKERSYRIVIGDKLLHSLPAHLKGLNIGNHAYVITNPVINRIWGPRVTKALESAGFRVKVQQIPDAEKSKSAATCLDVLNKLAVHARADKVFVAALGGGVVGDLSGFVASVYKRGIPYIQLPTTLLAQVDSAIGGKVAIDLEVGKNLVGAFYQPRLVCSDIDFLKTLPAVQLRNGLAETIKYGVIKERPLFEFLEKNLNKIFSLDTGALAYIVERSSAIKAKVVEQDEFDTRSVRVILNYGHTIGHAVEAASGYSKKYTHGMSVSIGMAAANFIARELGLLGKEECGRIEGLLMKAGLPVTAKGLSREKIYEAHLYDKKFIKGKNRFVLPVGIGKVIVAEGIAEGLVRRAINSICEKGA